MRQTEQSIRQSMDELKTTRPFVWEALELRKKLAQWQAQTANLNVLQLSELPPRQVQEMKAAEALLRTLQRVATAWMAAYEDPLRLRTMKTDHVCCCRACDGQLGGTSPQPSRWRMPINSIALHP
ncbi:unnamed protein product [Scytosiphon promiscuus]